jgi:glycosyltransferase involved in cell wall biosynthesis
MSGISIIVPVYNSEKYLKACLASLINQSLKDIEIIIINDGSTDKSEEIIKKFKEKYPNLIKYYSLKKNKGLGYVRNYGIEKSDKKYIGFVDSDDYVDTNMFEKMHNKIEKTSSDVCECNFIWEYPNKSRKDIRKPYILNKETITNIRALVVNKIYNRKLLIKNNIKFAENLKYEDILFTTSLVPFINKICFVSDYFYHYVQRKTSLINYQTKSVSDIYEVLNQVINFYKKNNLYKEYSEELEYLYVKYLYLSSFKRASHIENKKDRKDVLDEGYNLIHKNYPKYRKNKYLKNLKPQNIYMKYTNKLVYNLLSRII